MSPGVQILITILSSSLKFAMTFPLAIYQFRFSFWETLLWTNAGGILGIYFFAFLSEKVIALWRRYFGKNGNRNGEEKPAKKIFTKKNRRIVAIKQKYGLIGISLSTPFLLSIPVGTFLVVRYYRHSRIKFGCLIASNLLWSAIYTGFYMLSEDLVVNTF